MNFNKLISTFFVVFVILTSSAFADAFVSVNKDASRTRNLYCDVIQSQTDDGYIFNWIREGVPQNDLKYQIGVDSSRFTRGESWTCLVQKATPMGILDIGSDSTIIVNSAPQIISGASTSGISGSPYNYDNDNTVNAFDADGDSLSYAVIGSPSGMTINPSTGLISWTPSSAGSYPVTISVSDGVLKGTQSFTIIVTSGVANSAPVITSAPVTSGVVNTAYTYQVTATDANGDPLTYSLVTFPLGMTITSGLISWTPSSTGVYPVNVSVTDGIATVSQAYSLTVTTTGGSNSPVFSTSSCPDAEVKRTYTCNIDASGSGTIVYSLVSAPSNMSINSASGVITWNPKNVGKFTFIVRATDVTNLVSTDRQYTIDVKDNKASENDLFVDSIQFSIDQILSGDVLDAYVTLENNGKADFEEMTIKMSIEDLDVQTATDKFDLNDGDRETYRLSLDIPSDAQEGSYLVKFTISNDDIKVVKYKEVYVKGSQYSSVGNKKTNVDVVFTPSLTASAPTQQEARVNWIGIWFMILLILLLLALAAYLVKRMAEENQREQQNNVIFTSLDENMF